MNLSSQLFGDGNSKTLSAQLFDEPVESLNSQLFDDDEATLEEQLFDGIESDEDDDCYYEECSDDDSEFDQDLAIQKIDEALEQLVARANALKALKLVVSS